MSNRKNNSKDGTPDSPFYGLIFLLVRVLFGNKPEPSFELNGFDKLQGPYVLLSNHESFYDFYYLYKLPHKKKPVYVINRYYTTMPFLSFLSRRSGMIPKKIFFDDMVTPVRIMRMLKKGFPVIIYPEGRLCIDGRTNRLTAGGGAFFKKLGVDVVLTRVNGAFYEKPKWRSRRYHTPVSVTVERILTKEEISSMSEDEINRVIVDTISNDASWKKLCKYPQQDKAEGLHNILYRCCACNGLYTTSSKGNTITCSSCGRSFTLNDDYEFEGEPHTIASWYDRMTSVELENIKDISLEMDVTTVIYSNRGKKRRERGKCRLTYDEFSYESSKISFSYGTDVLKGLAFTSGEHVEVYYEDEMYYMYPDNTPAQCTRWAHLVDIINTVKEPHP